MRQRARVGLAWAVVVAWTAGWAGAQWSPSGISGISWHFFADGSQALLHTDGLHTYAVTPTLQIGPLALLLAGAFGVLGSAALPAAQVAMTAGAVIATWAVADRAPVGIRHTRVLATGLLLAPAWTVLAVRWAHLDDALALVLLALTVGVLTGARSRPVLAGLLVAGACAAKPWAVVGVPLLLLVPSLRGRVAAVATAGLGILAAWGPFVLADPGTLTALQPAVGVSDTSILHLLGWTGDTIPAWGRTAQLLGAPAASLALVLTRRWPAALLAGIAVRLALDPQDIAYYAAGAVLAALVWDLWHAGGPRRRVPWLALATTLVWWQPFVTDYARRFELAGGWALWWFEHPAAVAWLHLAWVLGALGLAFGGRFGRHTAPLVD